MALIDDDDAYFERSDSAKIAKLTERIEWLTEQNEEHLRQLHYLGRIEELILQTNSNLMRVDRTIARVWLLMITLFIIWLVVS